MIQDWFCDIYSSIKDRNAFLKQIRFYSLLRWFTRQTANIVLPIAFRLCPQKQVLPDKTKPQFIVSLTSFPARIEKVWLVVECLFRQTELPDKIILWLSKEQFASIDHVPARLRAYQAKGLDIRLVDQDFRSHKKYLYSLQQYPEAILITMDDDLFYRSTLIAELMAGHKAHPKAVIAHYTHAIRYENGHIQPYNEWKNNATEGDRLFFGSGGGTLFPPHALHAQVTDIKTAMRVCPQADDVWLNAMTRLNKTEIIHTRLHSVLLPVLNRKQPMLSRTNLAGGNDTQIQQVTEYCMNTFKMNPFAP